jgi:hypothetical protein
MSHEAQGSAPRRKTGSRHLGVSVPMAVADSFDLWMEARGLNVNQAIRLLITQALAERSPEAASAP